MKNIEDALNLICNLQQFTPSEELDELMDDCNDSELSVLDLDLVSAASAQPIPSYQDFKKKYKLS